MDTLNLTPLSGRIFNQNVKAGWWDPYPDRMTRYFGAKALTMSELSEGLEGLRKDLMDDHLPDHKMVVVEMADAAIRSLDYLGAIGHAVVVHKSHIEIAVLDIETCIDPMSQIWTIMEQLSMLGNGFHSVLPYLFAMAEIQGYDHTQFLEVIEEKLRYNANRADHKKENRQKEGGKKW